MPPRKGLTIMEEIAISAYIQSGFKNKTAACRKAGYAHPSVQAASVFERPMVKREIDKRRNRMKKKFEIEEERVLKGFLALAEANPLKILKKLEENDWDLSCLDEAEMYAVSKIKTEEGSDKEGYIDVMKREIGAESRVQAWDKIARILGMYDDKVTVKGEMSLVERIQAGRRRASSAADDEEAEGEEE